MATQTIDSEITQFNYRLADAIQRKDRATLAGLIHDDFLLLDTDGKLLEKNDWLSHVTHAASHLGQDLNRQTRRLSLSPDGTTVTEVADVELHGTLLGQDRSGPYIITATYVQGSHGWQLIGNTWQPGQSCPGCCGSMTVRRTCAVCGREGVDALFPVHP